MINALKTAAVCAMLALYGALTAGPVESTVQLCNDRGFAISAHGTGFVVSDHYVLTAKHVLPLCKNLRVRDYRGRFHVGYPARTGDLDYAWVYVPTLDVPAFAIDRDGVQQGEPLTAYGDFRNLVGGKLESTTGVVWDSMWQGSCQNFTGRVRPGYSGGPVLDRDGEVVGITSWCNMITMDSGYVPISAVKW